MGCSKFCYFFVTFSHEYSELSHLDRLCMLESHITETYCEGVKRESTVACVHKANMHVSWESVQVAAVEEDVGVFLQCEYPYIIT